MALPNNNKRKIFDGRYEILSIVGRGTDSVVYHARHAGSPTLEVALKVLLNQKDSSSLTERLRKEALTLVSCRHRYVVRLDDFHSVGDLCYLSMEYAAEGDLRKFVSKYDGQLNPTIAERFLRQCLEALDLVHATGVLHRDIKPDNILVMNEREIRIADFGLALLPGEEASLSDIQNGVGSMGYLPPEVIDGSHFDQRSDLYALGLSFYEMIAGSHPFDNLPLAEQLEGRQNGQFPALIEMAPGVSEHLNTIVMKLLKFNPAERFQNALNALKAINDPDYDEEAAENKAPIFSSPLVASPQNTDEELLEELEDDFEDFDPFADIIDEEEDLDQTPDPIAHRAVAERPQSYATSQPSAVTGVAQSEYEERPVQSSPTSSNAAVVMDPLPKDPPSTYPLEAANDYDPDEGERIPQPTEKIDLERIKEIIEKDAKQKADAARRRATQTHSVKRNSDAHHAQGAGVTKGGRAPTGAMRNAALPLPGFIGSAVAAFSRLPHAMRPVVVGLGAAVGTIIVVSIAQLFTGGDEAAPASIDMVAQNTQGGDTATNDESAVSPLESKALESKGSGDLTADTAFPAIPGGLYAGQITGIIPGQTTPFSLISLPKQGMVAVIVGIEGWGPVLVPSTNSNGEPIQPLVVRSNGMIINLTGAVTSGILEGAFANAVTGESGSWQVKKVS